jgi:hypothetical protein
MPGLIKLYMRFCLLIIPIISILSCISGGRNGITAGSEGSLILKTNFFDGLGNAAISDTIKLWFCDSAVIQDLHNIKRSTDTANKVTVKLEVFAYRYVDLIKHTVYDYSSLSDTARLIKKSALPDSMFMDYGWNFSSNKLFEIVGDPILLKDTTIENLRYKRAKFYTKGLDSNKFYQIGYFIHDTRGNLFSLEKPFSQKLNCTMTKVFSYKVGNSIPFASQEIEFLSNKLTQQEKSVFSSWKRSS